ncbi:MAG: tyrosine recombinase XerC [Candidatus Dojkabacteria bacterium]|nr:MAG: tyrosine recombinase XerC [Candidatus Dojkabacteria bacterium]
MNTTNELVASFTSYLEKQKMSPNTIIAYKKDIEQLAETNVQKDLPQFETKDIKNALIFLKEQKGLSPKTISRKLNSYRTFFNFLITTKKIKYNPALEVEHPKYINKKKRILKPTEYLALKEVSRQNERLFVIIETLLQTGIRIAELANLKIKDVDMSKKEITIEPYGSNEKRVIPINDKLFYVLKSYLEKHCADKDNNHPLFFTRTGQPIQIRNIRNSIDRAIAKANLKNVCVNDIRNTFIVHQLSQGVSTSYLAQIVGHKSESTTQKYLSLLSKKYKPSGKDKIYEV